MKRYRPIARAAKTGMLVAVVSPHDGSVQLLDPSKARRGKQVRLSEASAIENVLLWLDA